MSSLIILLFMLHLKFWELEHLRWTVVCLICNIFKVFWYSVLFWIPCNSISYVKELTNTIPKWKYKKIVKNANQGICLMLKWNRHVSLHYILCSLRNRYRIYTLNVDKFETKVTRSIDKPGRLFYSEIIVVYISISCIII